MSFAVTIGSDLFRAVLQGAPPGAVYALIALGFVLAYKTSGVFNLAFGAQAYVSAVVYFTARNDWEWGIVPAVVLSVVVLAPLVGVVLEWLIFRHLRTAPAVAKLVVTIGLSVALPALVDLAVGFEAVAGVTPEGIVPDGANVFYDPFGVYAYSRNELVAMAVAVLGVVALGALFRFSAVGLQMRAVVESPRMTELNGIAADRVSAFAWGLSSLFAGLAGVLIAPRFNTLAAPDFLDLVIVGVTAAAIGRLVSLPRAMLGGLGLGVAIAMFNTFLPRWSDDWTWLQPIQDNLTPAIPFVVLFGALVLVPSLRRSKEATDPLAGVDPPSAAALPAVDGDGRRVLLQRLFGGVARGGHQHLVVVQRDHRQHHVLGQRVRRADEAFAAAGALQARDPDHRRARLVLHRVRDLRHELRRQAQRRGGERAVLHQAAPRDALAAHDVVERFHRRCLLLAVRPRRLAEVHAARASAQTYTSGVPGSGFRG